MSKSPPLGTTGPEPDDKFHPVDVSTIQIAIGKSRGFVVVKLSKLVERLVLMPDEAEAIASILWKHATAIRGKQKVNEVVDEPGP